MAKSKSARVRSNGKQPAVLSFPLAIAANYQTELTDIEIKLRSNATRVLELEIEKARLVADTDALLARRADRVNKAGKAAGLDMAKSRWNFDLGTMSFSPKE